MTNPDIHILLVEDIDEVASLISTLLDAAEGAVFHCERVRGLSIGLDYLERTPIDAVVLNTNLPDAPGLSAIGRIHGQYPDVPLISLTDSESLEEGLQAIREGATDYLAKDRLDGPLLVRVVRYAIERKNAERRLRESEERYRRLLAAVTAYAYSVKLVKGRVVSTEHSFGCLATTGYAPEDFATDPYLWFRMVHPDDRVEVQKHVQRLHQNEELPPIEHRIVCRDGTTRWIRDTIISQFDSEGQLACYDGLIEDITERKRAEDALRQQQAKLIAAQQIQQHFLPDAAPALPGFDVAAALYPADFVAGDFFDYLPMRDGSMGFVVGDVSGHGLAPALIMASCHELLRSLIEVRTDLAEILTLANAVLCKETRSDSFVTLLLGCLNLASKTFIYASAGHPTGYLISDSGEVKTRLTSTAMPLAVSPRTRFPTAEPVPLMPGDLLLMLTDGVLEPRSDEGVLFGEQRVLDSVRSNLNRPVNSIVHELYLATRAFSQRLTPEDDATIMAIKADNTN